jgi:hypothetical protein
MTIDQQINEFISQLPEPKRSEIETLHHLIMEHAPNTPLWFMDGRDLLGKIVSNPNIGYGRCSLSYANGTTRDFYKIGISPNKTGISIYIFGIEDKTHLSKTYGDRIGKATITGYCIKFKSIKDVNLNELVNALRVELTR